MPEIIETTVYRFDELDDRAQEAAREWYRSGAFDDWYDPVFDDFEAICTILGVALATRPARLHGGGLRHAPQILFSGFSSQGDGACFMGHYAYRKFALSRLREYAPLDADLHAIADQLQALQRRNFYQLGATVRHRGRYSHEYSMDIAVERDSPTCQPMSIDAEDGIVEALRDLARWLYRRLEGEYDALNSDEAVGEAIRAGDHTFTDTGQRFG